MFILYVLSCTLQVNDNRIVFEAAVSWWYFLDDAG